jgi:hypothetical protein
MGIITLDKDIRIFYVEATSYPGGIVDAHQKLHSMVPFSTDRKYFGLSRPENEEYEIIYKVGTEEMEEGEAEKYSCQTLIIKKGRYIYQIVKDFRKEPENIGLAFEKLLTHPDLDPDGYCIEWYKNDQEVVTCMVRVTK